MPVNCGPRGLPPGFVQLYHNNGDGTFTDVSRQSGVAAATRSYPMTAVAADYDNDGWPDIYVACDSTPSWLFRNQHDGTFREEALERGVALSEDGLEQAGMGVGVGDYDLDGNLDIFKTHFADDTNVLYRNDGKGNFDDVTIRAGIGVETRYVGWGAGIVDLDNDGLPDLFFVTGSVYPEVERKLPAYPFRTPRLVFRNLGDGRFEELIEEAGPGVAAAHTSRGCAFGDFDNDGDMDILVMNMNEPPSLLRNDVSGGGHWLKVLLVGVTSNRSAIGARVVARYGGRTQAQEVTAQSSFYSANDRRLHFGLGAAASADLAIRWPNGATRADRRRRGRPARRGPRGSRHPAQGKVPAMTFCTNPVADARCGHRATAGRHATAVDGDHRDRRLCGRRTDQPATLRAVHRVHVRGDQVRPARGDDPQSRVRGRGRPRQLCRHHGSATRTTATTTTRSRSAASPTWPIRLPAVRTEQPADTPCASSFGRGSSPAMASTRPACRSARVSPIAATSG